MTPTLPSIALAPIHSVRRISRRLTAIAFALLSTATSLAAVPGAPAWGTPPTTSASTPVTLNWQAASGSPTSYSIRYRTSNSAETYIVVPGLPLTPRTYTVTGLNNFQSYQFQVAAVNGSGTTWGTFWHARPRPLIHTSGLHAGGQVNAIVRGSPLIMIAGCDVAGFQRSADGGITWRQSSQGVFASNGTRAVAALAYHAGSNTFFGLCGGGGTGHFWASTDNGVSWTNKHSGTDIYADANSGNYPREVGRLIAVENANTLYLGANSNGVRKSTNGGTSWTGLNATLNTKNVVGIALDAGFVFAAVRGEGVYRCTTSGGSLTRFTGTNSPGSAEEVFMLGGRLYVAAGTGGIRRLDSATTAGAAATWKNLGVGGGTASWCALDGYVDGSNHVLVVGNSNAEQLGATGRYTTVKKCANAEAASGWSWVDISSATTTTVNLTMAAGNGETYWRVDPAKGEGFAADWGDDKRIDGSSFNIDQIHIDPDDHDRIHVVGQMGIWRTLDSGVSWMPAVIGLSNAVLNNVVVDPAAPGRVYVGDTDNALWISDDYGETLSYAAKAPNASKVTIFAMDVDTNGLVYVGLEKPTTGNGGLWSYNRSTQTWTEIAGSNGTLRANSGNNSIHGVKVRHISGTRVILAAVANSGLWRLSGSGAWTRVQSSTMANLGGAVKNMPFAWATNSLVFFYDQHTGVWRSTNQGQNWTNIWSQTYSSQYVGSLAMRTNTTQLFATTDAGLYRLDGADAGTPTVVALSVANPGKLTAVGDTLWVAGRATPTSTADVKLHRSTNGSTFTTFTSNYYEGATGTVAAIAADAGRQYIVASGMGITVSDN